MSEAMCLYSPHQYRYHARDTTSVQMLCLGWTERGFRAKALFRAKDYPAKPCEAVRSERDYLLLCNSSFFVGFKNTQVGVEVFLTIH